MSRLSFREIGEKLSDYGYDIRYDLPLAAFIDTIGNDQRVVILLSTIVSLLMDIKGQSPASYPGVRADAASPVVDPVADGMLSALARGKGFYVSDLRPFPGLGVRAARIMDLLPAGTRFLDLNREMLMNSPNCGKTTAREILEWAEEYRGTQ